MIAHLLRAAPFPLTAFGIVGGIALIASGRLPLGVAGAALIVLGLLVPFLRLSVLRRDEAKIRPLSSWDEEAVRSEAERLRTKEPALVEQGEGTLAEPGKVTAENRAVLERSLQQRINQLEDVQWALTRRIEELELVATTLGATPRNASRPEAPRAERGGETEDTTPAQRRDAGEAT